MKDGDMSKIESVTRQNFKNEMLEDNVSLSGSVSSIDDKNEDEEVKVEENE